MGLVPLQDSRTLERLSLLLYTVSSVCKFLIEYFKGEAEWELWAEDLDVWMCELDVWTVGLDNWISTYLSPL